MKRGIIIGTYALYVCVVPFGIASIMRSCEKPVVCKPCERFHYYYKEPKDLNTDELGLRQRRVYEYLIETQNENKNRYQTGS